MKENNTNENDRGLRLVNNPPKYQEVSHLQQLKNFKRTIRFKNKITPLPQR